ncbi:MAG: helix-turn-helix transcriptional regulator [Candidatus Paceibacterota bacterium]|jgi:DNA-binding XRE family transcriptional regulator
MTKKKTKPEFITFEEMKREMFKRPGFKVAYDALGPKYALIGAMMDARNRKGMTQAEIARRAGTTQSAIARFEAGRTNPTLEFASRLSHALGARLEIRLAK